MESSALERRIVKRYMLETILSSFVLRRRIDVLYAVEDLTRGVIEKGVGVCNSIMKVWVVLG